jgi:hypothetical protein
LTSRITSVVPRGADRPTISETGDRLKERGIGVAIGGEVRLLASVTFGDAPMADNLGVTVSEADGGRWEEQR